MNLTRTAWNLGWTPCADNVNGDPAGLVRADNLTLDQRGVISLIRGLQQIGSDFPDYVDRIYSKNISGTEKLWLSCGPIGQYILRGVTSFTEFAEGTNRTTFGDALGNVLILAGRLRLKDPDGVSLPLPLGLVTAGTPTVSGTSQTTKLISGVVTALQGTSIGADTNSIYIQADQTASQAVALITLSSVTNTLDLGDGPAGNPANDIIQFNVTPDDSTTVVGMSVDFILGASQGGNNLTAPFNYFTYQVDVTTLLAGYNQQSTLTPKRSDFTRIGTYPLGWDDVIGVRFTYKTTAFNSCDWGLVTFVGGQLGQINGSYTYIQVGVNDNGIYQALSPCSTASTSVTVINGAVTIMPGSVDVQQANQVWYYRLGGTLDQYYRVGTGAVGVAFTDTLNDDDVLTLDIPLNPYLVSIQPLDDGNGIIDDIIGCAGLMYGRMLYMTYNLVYLSDFLDPDVIDGRYTLKASGDPSEINLWIKPLTNNVYLLGTNKNIYEITGTLTALPDGTIDAAINPIGEQYPPITEDVAAGEATVFYIGADGIRETQGSNSTQLSAALRLLFEGSNQWGIAPVVINPYADYAMAAGHGRFYISVPTTDGKIYLFIWDGINLYWRLCYTDPVSVYITVSGRVLLGYNLSANNTLSGGLFQLDVGNGIQDSTGALLEGWPFTFQTIFDANGQPRNRKDTFTLKIIANTGGAQVDAYLAKDGGSFVSVGNLTSTTLETFYFDINSETLGFRYAIQLLDHALVTQFDLYEITIEYDPRPEQNVYYRIQPNNLGSETRKRVVNFAFVIDTLSNSCQFQPIIDGISAGSPITFSTTVKQTVVYYFTSETIGTDFSGIITGGPFEFYGLNLEEIISEKMPVPCEFLVIPPNNYGTPNRKRHSSYKFQINTRGASVTFTPIIDGVSYTPASYNTSVKQTVDYFFTSDTIGIDIGGTLAGATPFEFYGTVVPQTVEQLPDQLVYYKIPNSNLGSVSRKRFINYALILDTLGQTVNFFVLVDDLSVVPYTTGFTTNGKQTCIFYFIDEIIGTDIGGYLVADTSTPFECYGVDLQKCISEELPTPCEYLVIPANDYGKPNRKRHSSYKFQINTRGADVLFTPILDGIEYPVKTFNTSVKQTVEYFFQSDIIAIDIGGILECSFFGVTPFEFYGTVVPQEIELLPARLEYYRIPNSNLGSVSRKRIINYAFVIDTYGQNVTFTPVLDGNSSTPTAVVNTVGKETFIYYFLTETICTDIGGTLEGNSPFEFYGLNPEKIVSEDMPVPCKYLVIPANNYGTPNRKRHTSYKFQINTRGQNVLFTPILDGVTYAATTFNTLVKRTVEYFFPESDIIGIDVGGTLQSLTNTPFEFYGVIVPQTVEQLPDRLEFLRIPNNNMGVAARKRVRTLPIVIDTYGQNVLFTPIVDGINQSNTTILNTQGKITTYHFFSNDSFGTDYGGTLQSVSNPLTPFEFYGMGNPENVEVLPVPRIFDQLGPLRLDKIAKFFTIRVRLIGTGTTTALPWAIYGSNATTVPIEQSLPLISGVLTIIPYIDEIYEIQLPKSINTDVVRITLGPVSDPFHRYDVKVRLQDSGMETNAQWIPMR